MTKPVENHPCAVCGQRDDHPVIHVQANWQHGDVIHLNPSFHFDCLPPEYEALIADGPQHTRTRDAIAAARSGVHGDELRAHIASLPDDNTLEA